MLGLTWVTVCEQGADGQQHLGDGEGGAPVVLQDVQADHALTVDVAVIDPRTKRYLRTRKRWRSASRYKMSFIHKTVNNKTSVRLHTAAELRI